MATVGTLAVNLVARTAAFDKGLKKGTRGVRDFSRGAEMAAARVKALASTALAAVAGGGIAMLFRSITHNFDTLGKLADRLSMSTEALGGLGYAAQINGVATESFNKSLEQMVRRLGEAQSGYGTAGKALDRLGLSASRLASIKPEQSFLLIADAISKLPTPTAKATTAYELFGRQGIEMLNMLNQGSSGIEQLMKRFEDLGGTIDRAGIARVEKYNDIMTDMRIVVTAAARDIAVKIVPALTNLANKFIQNKDAIFDNIKFYGKLAIQMFAAVKVFKIATTVIRGIVTAYQALAVGQSVVLALSGPGGWKTLAVGAVIAAGAVAGVAQAFDKVGEAAYTATIESENAIRSADKINTSLVDWESQQDKVTASVTSTTKAYETVAEAVRKAANQKFGTASNYLVDQIDEYRDRLRKLQMSEREYFKWQAMEIVRLDQKQRDVRLKQVEQLMSLYDTVTALEQQEGQQIDTPEAQAMKADTIDTTAGFGFQGVYGLGLGNQTRAMEEMNYKLQNIERYTQNLSNRMDEI